ncbi:putative membrane protein [Hartmannibacter diazotrophicus]|uniref:Putative membrane protein n=1 Tax=Hartmannibacter diazotrophicus TaxID=1482074 RepID=A0A2C9DD70_9HYPH|nr:low temperature requirement protein A [Hartmannibacter diazotrophicus]SON58196.1 putative membrane protein [Hartmannibacter diazotrophicus]
MSERHARLVRQQAGHEHAKVSFVELFFDLVFVFAITQLSHTLLHHFTLAGVAEAGLILLAVWWVWIYTTWVTNWLDPDKMPVRLMLFVLMLAGLVLSTSIPEAFEDKGLAFAIAYASMQVGRSVFAAFALRHHSASRYRNFLRISSWLAVAAVFWIIGGLLHHEARYAAWLIALGIEYAAPAAGFWTPGLGRTQSAEWDVEGGHMAERCGLFIIIALGESVLITGATFADLPANAPNVLAFLAAFTGSVAMWAVYFNVGSERASHLIAASEDPGRIARLAYTYMHIPIVAGIVLAAAGDQFALAGDTGHQEHPIAYAIVGGPALFLAGVTLFKRVTAGWWPLSHLVGLAAFIVLGIAAAVLTPLQILSLASLVLVAVSVWEHLSLRSGAGAQ